MELRRMLLAAAVLLSCALGAPAPASSQTAQRAACEAYCGAVVAGCYVFFGIFVGEACARMYEGCVAGCYTALEDSADEGKSGGGGF